MQSANQTPTKRSTPSAAALVLALAKQLHRSATADSLAQSLPALRRIIASNTLQDIALPELHRRRNMVQRKHLLRTLAVEAGYASWENYRSALDNMTPQELAHFDLKRGSAGYPNLWFSTQSAALAHARKHGGHVMQVGQQGVVLPDLAP